ncbi:MAG: oligoribonuclease [Propionibacteriaceae bacterium]|nr:oligoribonuclease [Propionibacteriaceae bacterium]
MSGHEELVWIDCEMTGLDITTDALIEVAVLVTDAELNILGDGVDVIIATPEDRLDAMGDFVREMHTKSGLVDEIRASTVTMAEAEALIMDYVKQYVPEADKAPLAGNTIGTDRAFLARDMPTLEGYVHYRNVDVSTIKELAHRWYPRAFHTAPEKAGNHRALADIKESIRELRYYRAAVFVPPPGLTVNELKALAAAS